MKACSFLNVEFLLVKIYGTHMHGTEPCQRSHYSGEFPSIYIQAGKGDVALKTESKKTQ